MKVSNPTPPTSRPANQHDGPTPEEILAATQRMIGAIAPYLCFGVAQHQAWLKAALIGATPDHDRCVRAAENHLRKTDPAREAAAVIHAGMLYVAARKAGIGPADAGWAVDQAIAMFLPDEEAAEVKPATDY